MRPFRADDDNGAFDGRDDPPSARRMPRLQDHGGRRGAQRGLREKDRRRLVLQGCKCRREDRAVPFRGRKRSADVAIIPLNKKGGGSSFAFLFAV